MANFFTKYLVNFKLYGFLTFWYLLLSPTDFLYCDSKYQNETFALDNFPKPPSAKSYHFIELMLSMYIYENISTLSNLLLTDTWGYDNYLKN